MRLSGIKRIANRASILFRGRLACYDVALSLVTNRAGLEIGGPSAVFRERFAPLPIYGQVASLDNCNFSPTTVWATHADSYTFSSRKAPGRIIISDASDLACVADASYDFILSSHNLEHIANPVKAIKQWQRVTRPRGGLILVLPDHTKTFDHRREPTTVEHMLADFDQDTQEDDLTHLSEILELHDLSMDPQAGSPEHFRQRSLDNFTNRCLHHHVFNQTNSRLLLSRLGMTVLAVESVPPHHIFLLARMP